MNDLTHIDLFSGIGGFALAAGWAGFRTIAMCEIEPFCQEVLKARFGAVKDSDAIGRPHGKYASGQSEVRVERDIGPRNEHGIHRPTLIPDIRDFDGTRFRGATLLTGGFPCQPFSHAGKRRGREDDRALWPQMHRVIAESRPKWVIGENVSGLIGIEDGMAFEQVHLDLEGLGYSTQTFHIGTVGVNAPHRRMRVWIIAHLIGDPERLRGQGRPIHGRDKSATSSRGETNPCVSAGQDTSPDAQDPLLGGNGGRGDGDTSRLRRALQTQGPDSDAPDADRGRCQQCDSGLRAIPESSARDLWDIPWIEVATRLCRVDDGLPAWIHAHRVQRLKALGNSICPQVAYEICKAIAEIEKEER